MTKEKEKKIVLNESEKKAKEEQIEELDIGIEGTTLNIEMLEKEIAYDLPMRQSKAQLRKMKLNLENYKKTKEIISKQLESWK